MADVLNAKARGAWSADFYGLSKNAYRNNDLRVEMLLLVLRTINGVKSTLKLFLSKTIVTDGEITRSKVERID